MNVAALGAIAKTDRIPLSSSVTITVLVENSVARAGLVAEHGLAFWIDMGSRCILFDAGQTSLLAANAKGLGIELDAVDTVVLSHGHYDHGGGLSAALAGAAGDVAVYAHPHALLPKYQHKGTGVADIGLPLHSLESLRQQGNRVHAVTTPTEIAPGLFLTGEIPRAHPEEQSEPGFCCDPEGRTTDSLLDDQALYLLTPAGSVVLLGCAHAGVINTLDHIQRLTQGRPVRAVMGGMHLRAASDDRIAWTMAALRGFAIESFYPAHCTGIKAIAALWAAFPNRCLPCGVGTQLTI